MLPPLSVPDCIQGRSQVHVFFCKVLSHIIHPCFVCLPLLFFPATYRALVVNLLPSILTTFIHSGHFYSAPSSPLLLRGVPDYSTDTVSEFHTEAHRQLLVKDLPKVPTWRLERESNPRPSGCE